MANEALSFMLALALAGGGCDREPARDTHEQREVDRYLPAIEQTRDLLQALNILPTYDCGEPRRHFVGRIAEGARAELPCATIEAIPTDDARDTIVMTFAEGGCTVRGHTIEGVAVFDYAGGEDRLDLELDATQAIVDGVPLGATLSAGECGDGAYYGFSFQRDGHAIAVRFSERSYFHGTMDVTIDSEEPVTVPVPL